MDAGILQVLDVQFYRSVSDVQLASYNVGDEAGAVLLREVDLVLGSFNGSVDACRLLVYASYDGALVG